MTQHQPQKKQNSDLTESEILDISKTLTSQEAELINLIRKRFRFGQITIEVRDGQPYRVLKAYESQDL